MADKSPNQLKQQNEAIGVIVAVLLLWGAFSALKFAYNSIFAVSGETTQVVSETPHPSKVSVKNLNPSASPAPGPAPAPAPADVSQAAAIVKNQFYPDEIGKSSSASYQKEWWMIKGALRQAGYPCAAVAFVQQKLDGTFKAVCKIKLHANEYDSFVINPDTHSIDTI